MQYLFKIIINSLSIFIASSLLSNVTISNYFTAIWVAVVIAFLNVFFKPLLILLTIPITLFTFGIFLLFINAIIILLASSLIEGFTVETFWSAFVLSLLISILNYIFEYPAIKANRNENKNENY